MKSADSDTAPGGHWLRDSFDKIIAGWNKFWFTPGDPTLLGAMRICAGMIALYVHFAYSYDLQEFVGRYAWMNLDDYAEIRQDIPHIVRPSNWRDPELWAAGAAPRPSEEEMKADRFQPKTPEEERAFMEYMKRWEGTERHKVYSEGYYMSSIWFLVADPPWLYVTHGVILLIFFLFTIGFCTRVTSVLAWLAALSFMQRAQTSLFGMDTIMNFVLLYLAIGPSGAALSVDRLIERYWRSRRMLRRSRAGKENAADERDRACLEAPAKSVSANFALRLLQVHLCIVYLASGLSKLQGNSWWQGTAIWGTMINPEFSPVHNWLFVHFLDALVANRWLWEIWMTGGVIFTLAFEIGFPFLVWNPRLRWIFIAAAVALHTGIALIMGLTTFSLIMLTAVMSFIPQEALHRLLRKIGRGKEEFQLVYNGRDRREVRAAAVAHTFDVWQQGSFVEASTRDGDDSGLHLVTDKGDSLTGQGMFHQLTRSLRLLWPLSLLASVPGFSHLGRSLFTPSACETRAKEPAVTS